MPGLRAITEKKGLLNINTIMDRRELERTQQESISQEMTLSESELVKRDEEVLLKAGGITITEKMYGKIFDEKIGVTTRRKYESGHLPHLHKLLLGAILEAMGNDTKKHITLDPLLKNLSMSRAQSINILSCLEHYGYLSLERIKNSRGKPLMFTILKTIPTD